MLQSVRREGEMTCQVFVQRIDENGFRATPLLFPDCVAIGKTRDEALARLKEVLNERLSQGEIVTVEVGEPRHPWLKGAGMFKDDPNYDEFLAAIDAYRREVDEADPESADLSAGH
jgi:predicted RNase H-like HicB family nuclease